jgi:hypothetical protein
LRPPHSRQGGKQINPELVEIKPDAPLIALGQMPSTRAYTMPNGAVSTRGNAICSMSDGPVSQVNRPLEAAKWFASTLCTAVDKVNIADNDEPIRLFLHQGLEGCVNIAFGSGVEDKKLKPESTSRHMLPRDPL